MLESSRELNQALTLGRLSKAVLKVMIMLSGVDVMIPGDWTTVAIPELRER